MTFPTRFLVGIGVVALLAAAGCVDREAQKQAKKTEQLTNDPTIPVVTGVVTPRTLTEVLEITGSITVPEDTSVGATNGGKLVAVYVKDGDPVRAGQPIAQLETQDVNARIAQARAGVDAARSQLQQARNQARVGPTRTAASVRAADANVQSAKAMLDKARAGARPEERRQAEAAVNRARSDMETAKSNLERQRRLFAEGAVAKAQLEQAENVYANALSGYETALEAQRIVENAVRSEDLAAAEQAYAAAQEQARIARSEQALDVQFTEAVRSAEANLRSAEETLTIARKALTDATVRAPFGGRISGQPLQAGTVVAPGTPIARIVDASGAYFEAQVSERDVNRIELGAPVTITVDALEGRSVQGSVVAVNPVASSVARQFSVRVQLDGNLPGLKAGMFGRGRLELGRQEGTPTVPASAVLRDGEKAYVYTTATREGKIIAKRQGVQTGLTSDGFIAVEGLPVGAELIIQGQTRVADGTEVRVTDPGSLTAPTGSPAEGSKTEASKQAGA